MRRRTIVATWVDALARRGVRGALRASTRGAARCDAATSAARGELAGRRPPAVDAATRCSRQWRRAPPRSFIGDGAGAAAATLLGDSAVRRDRRRRRRWPARSAGIALAQARRGGVRRPAACGPRRSTCASRRRSSSASRRVATRVTRPLLDRAARGGDADLDGVLAVEAESFTNPWTRDDVRVGAAEPSSATSSSCGPRVRGRRLLRVLAGGRRDSHQQRGDAPGVPRQRHRHGADAARARRGPRLGARRARRSRCARRTRPPGGSTNGWVSTSPATRRDYYTNPVEDALDPVARRPNPQRCRNPSLSRPAARPD